MIIDTHAHLDNKQFENDLDQVIQRAKDIGVNKIITIGCDLKTSRKAVEISKTYENIFTAVGIQPTETSKNQDNQYLKKLFDLAKNNAKVKAIGEIGLDYYWEGYNIPEQQQYFQEQISLAKELNIPIIIHSRNAERDILEILKKENVKQAVIHCFPGNKEYAEKCLELGCFLSFTGIVTFNKADNVRAAVEICPLEKMFIETDCPYLAPVPYRGKRNEPAFCVEIAQKIAEIKKIPFEHIAMQTAKNAEEFFGI